MKKAILLYLIALIIIFSSFATAEIYLFDKVNRSNSATLGTPSNVGAVWDEITGSQWQSIYNEYIEQNATGDFKTRNDLSKDNVTPTYIRIDFYCKNANTGDRFIWDFSNGTDSAFRLGFCRNESIFIHNGTSWLSIGNISSNYTYSVELRDINFSTKRYNLYINDTLNKSNIPFEDDNNEIDYIYMNKGNSHPTVFYSKNYCIATETCLPDNSNFSIQTIEIGSGDPILNFSAYINGTLYNSNVTTGILQTNYTRGTTSLLTIEVSSIGYINSTYSNYNVTNNLLAELSPSLFASIEYSNYTGYSGLNYTRHLNFTINYTCVSNTTINMFLNSSLNKVYNLSCDGSTTKQIFDTYQADKEQLFNFSFYLNNSDNASQNEYFGNNTFQYDLYPPNASINFFIIEGFNIGASANVSLFCNDSIAPVIEYNNTFNGNNILLENQSPGTNITNQTTAIEGSNTQIGKCSDFFSTRTRTRTKTFYIKEFALIDEIDNTAFDLTNLTTIIVYYDDNSSTYNFKTEGTTKVNFTTEDSTKLRFEFGDYDQDEKVIRYFDPILVEEDEIRVCVNKDDMVHFEQIIISATQKPALLESMFSNCYVTADYTRFAYQDSLALKAYTIETQYSLITYQNGNQVILASLDGSIQTFINIDTLEFRQNAFNVAFDNDYIEFEKTGNRTMVLVYTNMRQENEDLTLTIKNKDNGNILFYNDMSTPNNFTLYFDYTTIPINDTTLFRVDLDIIRKSGTELTLTRTFNPNASFGIIPRGLAVIIAILGILFGFTLASTREALGWFGMGVFAIVGVVLSLAIPIWYTVLLQAVCMIGIIYCGIMLVYQNYPAVT